jgi:hypothetical protein
LPGESDEMLKNDRERSSSEQAGHMENYFYQISFIIGFVLMNFMPAVGAFYMAQQLNRGGRAELFLLTFLIFFFEVIVIFGIAGMVGLLNAMTCLIGGVILGGVLCFMGRKKKKIPEAVPLRLEERILAALAVGLWLIRVFWSSRLHSGTDTFLYHFYYPTMWLLEERIYSVTIAGLPHEYFPFYGEMLYGWLMFPVKDASFAIFLQLFSMGMAAMAILAVGKAFGFGRSAGLGAVCIMFATSIISENANLGYTDVLNGSFLLAGTSGMLIGALRNDWKMAVVAGLALGCSAAIKYSGLMLTPLLVMGLLLFMVLMRRKLWRYALVLAAAASVAASPCYLVNWLKTGNPFYPVKIMPFGIPLFPAGIDFERSAGGMKVDTWRQFVNANIWDMNVASGIFYSVLPVLVIGLFIFLRPKRKKQWVFPVLAGICLVLGMIQLHFYPAMAQARQIIPLLMCSSLLILPVTARMMAFRFRIIGFAGIPLLCFLLSQIVFSKKMFVMWIAVSLFVLLLSFWKDRFFRYGMGLAGGVFICFLPFCFQARLQSMDQMKYIFSGPVGAESSRIVKEHYYSARRGINIASVCSWYNYMYLADMPGNRVLYVPINEENSTHPHDFHDYREMRDKPVPYSVWLERLRTCDIDYLVVDYSAHADFMTNWEQEVRWAKEHPETFEKLIDNGQIFFFRLKK